MNLTLYKDNSNLLELEELTDADGELVSGAIVTVTLSRGAATVFTDTLDAGDAGSYSVVVPADLAVDVGEKLAGVVEATASGLTLSIRAKVTVRQRSN